MKFCQAHWDALRGAIEARGLGHLVAKDGRAAAENLASELEDGQTIQNYDPLMSAHWAIVGNASALAGPGVMFQDGCPLCFLRDDHAANCREAGCEVVDFDNWIDRAADDEAERALRARP